MVRKIMIIIEKDEDGTFIAYAPALKGCYTQARNMTELKKRIKEAVLGWLEAKAEIERRKSMMKLLDRAGNFRRYANGKKKDYINISADTVFSK